MALRLSVCGRIKQAYTLPELLAPSATTGAAEGAAQALEGAPGSWGPGIGALGGGAGYVLPQALRSKPLRAIMAKTAGSIERGKTSDAAQLAIHLGSCGHTKQAMMRALRGGWNTAAHRGQFARATGAVKALTAKGAPKGQNALKLQQQLLAQRHAAAGLRQAGGMPNTFMGNVGYTARRILRPFSSSRRIQYQMGNMPNTMLGRSAGYIPQIALGVSANALGYNRGLTTGAAETISAYENMPFYNHLLYGLAGPIGLRPMMTDYGIQRAQDNWNEKHPWLGWAVGPSWGRMQNMVEGNRV